MSSKEEKPDEYEYLGNVTDYRLISPADLGASVTSDSKKSRQLGK